MRSALPKELHLICGRPLLRYVLEVADTLDAAQTVVVLSERKLEPVRALFGERYQYALQGEQLGTGHALLQAREHLEGAPGDVLVLYGDSPLITVDTARSLVEARRNSGALVGLLSFHAHPPTGYGRVLRDADGQVLALIEERNATQEQRAITEGNSGFMAFDGAWLWQRLPQVPRNPVKGEYYLTHLVEMAVEERGPGAAVAIAAPDAREAWGANDRAQLADAERVVRERLLNAIMRSGVTVIDPANTYVDADVTVGRDTTIWPGTLIRGATTIGARCELGPHTTIIDSRIGDGASVRYALVEQAQVASGAQIGPFVHMSAPPE
jgi:bifunctional UDP-N-acetylglucosamine pyrophosphorylase/glucosamine-1-phosphate N-acetyltransferase